MTDAQYDQTIHVPYLHIRQSISFLIVRLITLEVLFSLCFLIFYFIIKASQITYDIFNSSYSALYLFLVIIILKVLLAAFIIINWLSEYYEITPTKLIHRKGIFFKWQEQYVFSHIMSADIQQGIGGKIFNYGTIHIFDRYIYKHIYLYLIHNPLRYYHILVDLLPNIDKQEEKIREHLIEHDDQVDYPDRNTLSYSHGQKKIYSLS